MSFIISAFKDQYRWLSNFEPCNIMLQGVEFSSVEHAYQASKHPPAEWHRFQGITAGQAKRLGSYLKTVRPDWDTVKVQVMRRLLRIKFDPHINPELARKLHETGHAILQEGNSWGDTFWGICRGTGQNILGELLMEIRQDLAAHYV